MSYARFRDGLAAAIDQRLFRIEYLDALIEGGHAKIWTGDVSAIVAALKLYPTGIFDIHGLCATGDLEEITASLIPQAEEFGRGLGCAGALIESRAGWKRQLAPSGYEVHQTSLRKVLE